MIINFIGNYQSGYVGEVSDESHLADELEALGHTVQKVPRDIWKAVCDDEMNSDWVDKLPIKADINIIAKWHHFNDGKYIGILKSASQAPVLYWVWDYMKDPEFADWHLNMAREADLYLSGELGLASQYKLERVKFYYFQMDVCDGTIPSAVTNNLDKHYDVIFTGSCVGQGDRIEFLKKINQEVPIRIYAWNPEEWIKHGFTNVQKAVYGEDYNIIISQSKVILGLSVEPHCFGYWSNRVGKVIKAGGRLLQQYAPGMEQLLPLEVNYFSTPEEAVRKIRIMLDEFVWATYSQETRNKFSSKHKMKQLTILMERFLVENKGEKWILP